MPPRDAEWSRKQREARLGKKKGPYGPRSTERKRETREKFGKRTVINGIVYASVSDAVETLGLHGYQVRKLVAKEDQNV